MQTENLTNPGQLPVDGDKIRVIHDNGATEEKQYWEPVAPPTPTRRDVIMARLSEIDAITDRPRTRRELQLDKADTKAWLQSMDDEAFALREELKTIAAERAAKRATELGGGGGPHEPP